MSDFFDYQALVPAIAGKNTTPRFRVGVVQSVEAYTCTVTVAGSTTAISGVRYLAHVQPAPGQPVWLVSDGADVFVFGVIAAADRTFAPRAYRNSALSVSNATDTFPTMSGVFSDTWSAWSAGNASRLTAKLAGRYIATASVEWAANATGLRALWIEEGNGTEWGRVQGTALSGSPTNQSTTTPPFTLAIGEYIRMGIRQASGGALDLNVSGGTKCTFSLIYLGP